MQKEEFPTFLNEQPTIIFNRTGRELLLIAVGAIGGYSIWVDLSNVLQGNPIVTTIIKVLVVVTVAALALVMAFVKVAQRPLEEWALVWAFYTITPKVYIYTTVEENVQIDEKSYMDEMDKIVSRTSDEEDDYD
jgi:hypothetical protein